LRQLGLDSKKLTISVLGRNMNNLALLYQSMGDNAKAEPLYRQALDIRKKALGDKHPDYSASLNNLAVLYYAIGDYAKAEPLVRQALDIQKKALGDKHPDYAQSFNNLAELYRAMGDYAKAEPLYRPGVFPTARSMWTVPSALRRCSVRIR
jgi:tetratricopeptide (TPR) repeat protein